jgi:NADH:ubiquinone oxidoreductase subunit 2 (subunit N)
MLSAAAGSAALFAIDKLLLIGGADWLVVATAIGIVGFVGANLFALAQDNDRRLLGYSSVAQIGLVLVVIGQRDLLGEHYLFIGGGILLAHAVAKAGPVSGSPAWWRGAGSRPGAPCRAIRS